MVTFVANVEPQNVPARTVRAPAPSSDYPFAAALVSLLTLFAVAVHGYHPYAEDGGLYMAGVKRLLDPSLYPDGTAFVMEPVRLSLFAPAVASVTRAAGLGLDRELHVALPLLLLALHLASVWVTLFAAWFLAARCWSTREARAGAVALLACWLGLPVAGTALLLMDPYLTARSLSTPCMALALVGALDMTSGVDSRLQRRGLCIWVTSIAVAATMHPLMAIYALGATLMLVCERSSQPRVRQWGSAALAAFAIMLAAALQQVAKPESADYVRVAATRTYWFLAQWHWYELVGLAAPLVILGIITRTAPSRSHTARPSRAAPGALGSLARMAVAAGATATLIALLDARAAAATHLVARLQPLRVFQIVYVVMALALGAQLGAQALRRSAWRWAVTMLLLCGAMLGAARTAFPASNHLELPGSRPRNSWVQAFLWIRRNTPNDALFALDADYINAPGEDAQCFRAIAERSALPDYSKDGGEASIAPELTAAWTSGQAAQQRLSAPATTDAERVAALAPLGVTWVVLQAGAATRFDCPFQNAGLRVCRMR